MLSEVCVYRGRSVTSRWDVDGVCRVVELDDESRGAKRASRRRHVAGVLRRRGGQPDARLRHRGQPQVQLALYDPPSHVAAVVVLEDDEERSADGEPDRLGGRVARGRAAVRHDWFDLGRGADALELAHERGERRAGRVAHHPVADGGKDVARRELLVRALRVDAGDARHEEEDGGVAAHHRVARVAVTHDEPPRRLEQVAAQTPDDAERPHVVTVGDDARDETRLERVLDGVSLEVVARIAALLLRQRHRCTHDAGEQEGSRRWYDEQSPDLIGTQWLRRSIGLPSLAITFGIFQKQLKCKYGK